MFELRSVTKRYGGKVALDGISLSVSSGSYLSLLGPSGSGKSTLLRVLAGYEAPDAGEVRLDGQPLTAVPAHERDIGFVSQGFALFPHLSVFENVAFGLRYHAHRPLRDPAELRRRVLDTLEMVGLTDFAQRQIAQLSGGQKQRVALARTLVVRPRLCLLDEPLGALDANLRQRMTMELRRIHQALGITFFHVTGNELEALAMGDRVVVLDGGRILQVDEPDTVYNRPSSIAVARFLNRYNLFAGRVDGNGRLETAAGVIALPSFGQVQVAENVDFCIRIDKISVTPEGQSLESGMASLPATYITSEFSGAIITHLFRLDDGRVAEVEDHLSHRRPAEYEAGTRYRLAWPRAAGLVFPDRAPMRSAA
ncbi:MAG TPA: ABC transporter ATP-binding protein [Acidisoma sp.]|jgi:putative spermidine/putrescine transport system ATP-binding protein|nr:ABC transporter ATP-binding protein [Acidisoma sp.]